MKVVDLFSGAGGFSIAAHRFTDHVTGIELDADCVATQRAADMHCIQADVTEYDPAKVARWRHPVDDYLHLHASPPCTTFSAAGTGKGREHLDRLGIIIRDLLTDGAYDPTLAVGIDAVSLLVTEPARWIGALQPDSISFEQVRAVLPLWEIYADYLENIYGYSVWCELLSGEQFGLPQTRVRAWLGASRGRDVTPPVPTHSKYHIRSPERLDDGVLPWVSMAEALGWEPESKAGFLRRADSDDAVEVEGVMYRRRDIVEADERPSLAVTEKMRSWTHWVQSGEKRATTRLLDEPAGTVKFGHDSAQMRFTDDLDDWGYESVNRDRETFTHYAPAGVSQKSHPASPRELDAAPAPTVTSQANHYFYNADAHNFGDNLATDGPTRARKITVEEAATLQGFPVGFPFRGSKTSTFKMIGNAVPPPIGEVVLRSLLSEERNP